jgi:hypothetical protein
MFVFSICLLIDFLLLCCRKNEVRKMKFKGNRKLVMGGHGVC